jgi:phytol kinase
VSDLALAGGWLAVLGCALAGGMVLRAFGFASTYIRDLLHIGAGVWVLGWPWWSGHTMPIAIVTATALGVALVPVAARRVALAAQLERSVSGGDERWSGLVLYTLAYAVLTAVGLCGSPFPAAAGLLALSLGDGIGGAAGRAFGRHHFHAPGGKRKSLEGSAVVALGAIAGVAVASQLFGSAIGAPAVIALGALAAIAEAGAPRGTDNLLVPLAVWLAAHAVT